MELSIAVRLMVLELLFAPGDQAEGEELLKIK
jgi:hypothetical protein